MDHFLPICAAVFGAVVGSFLNVCIARLPEGGSPVKPRSFCPQCKTPIAWYDNIPILSWVFLRCQCRHCRKQISWQYPIIEALTAFLGWAFLRRFGLTVSGVIFFLFACSMVVVAVIDLYHRIIPNIISLPGIVAGLLSAFLLPEIDVIDSLIGVFAGGGVLYAIAEFYRLVRKIEGMGMGDVKLLAMIGAFLGWRPLFFVVLLASATGAILGVSFIVLRKRDWRYQIPFGTFLAAAAVAFLLWGNELIIAWESLLAGIVT